MNNEEKMAEIWIMYSGTAHNEITFILFYFIHVCSKVVTESSVGIALENIDHSILNNTAKFRGKSKTSSPMTA